MKKSKRFGKAQIALAVMVVALAAAVGLNMKYSAEQSNSTDKTSSKYLGQAEYVNATVSNQSDDKKEENAYFEQLRKNRQNARQEALDILEETLERKDLTEAQRAEAVAQTNALAQATEQEAGIETVLKAKGFKNVIAVVGENDVNIIVDVELDAAKTAQIQDAATSQTFFTAADIKIISADKNS